MSTDVAKNGKSLRHQSLRRILAENQIVGQEEVVERMLSEGFQVTQSSISRDFKELGVAKVGGRYVVPPSGLMMQLGRFVLASDSAGDNLFVVKTASGWTSAISEAMDHAEISGVVGTLAGENTIFIATKDGAAHAKIKEFLATL